MPKISVIVPIYNAEKYISRCLDSIINQTFSDIEIILINDESTDNSLSVCKEYEKKDSRIKLIDKKNGGLAAARNTGIKNSTGDFISFIDDDDWIEVNFLEKLYNAIEKYNCDISFCEVVRKNEKKHKIRLHLKDIEVAEDIDKKLELARYNSHRGVWNKLYRKTLFDNGLDFLEGKDYEDGLFTLRALNECKNIVSVPDTFYYYFINPTSIVKSKPSLQRVQDKNLARINVLNYATQHGIKIFDKKNLPRTFKLVSFGITLFTIKESQFEKRYYLFNAILIFKRKK